jgi:hypothetical protein
MHRQTYRIVIATLAVAAIACPAAAASRRTAAPTVPNSVTFTNSGTSDPMAPLINSVTVSNDGGGELTFQVNIANRPQLTSDMLIALALNTDQNAATGDPNAGGADYSVFVDPLGIGVLRWNGTGYDTVSTQSPLSDGYTPSGATINVNTADLGGTSSFNFFATAISGVTFDSNGNPDNSNAHLDAAPRQGSWPYQLKSASLTLAASAFQTRPSRATGGHPFQALLTIARSDGAQLANAQVTCTATIAGKPLAAKAHSTVGDIAWCGWLIPKTARGKTLHATVTVTSDGAQASRSYTSKIK